MKLSFSAVLMGMLGFIACKSSPVNSTGAAVRSTNSKQENDSLLRYQRVAKDQLAEPIHYQFNGSRTLVLCLHEEKGTLANQMMHPVTYLVYDVKNDQVIHQDQLANGYVAWYNDTQLKVSPVTEAASRHGNAAYVFDLPSKRRIDQNQLPH